MVASPAVNEGADVVIVGGERAPASKGEPRGPPDMLSLEGCRGMRGSQPRRARKRSRVRGWLRLGVAGRRTPGQ